MSRERDLRLAYSSLTDTVYAVKTGTKNGYTVIKEQEDLTSDFWKTLVTIMGMEENKNGRYIGTKKNPREFVVKMEKADCGEAT